MADDVLFLGWGTVVRGREQQAFAVFQETVQFWGQQQQDGNIESFEPILLEPHGGDLLGFMLIRGTRARLDAIRADPEFQRQIARAGTIVDDIGTIAGYGDQALARQMALFQEASQELAAT